MVPSFFQKMYERFLLFFEENSKSNKTMVYVPKKVHPCLQPAVAACVREGLGFDFWGDEDETFESRVSMLVQVSETVGLHVSVCSPGRDVSETFAVAFEKSEDGSGARRPHARLKSMRLRDVENFAIHRLGLVRCRMLHYDPNTMM
jgi:hypothetical protein